MKKKVALYAFNGDPMCVVHVWLNALEMQLKDFDVKIIFWSMIAINILLNLVFHN